MVVLKQRGPSTSPCTKPDSLRIFKCWDTVDWASGNWSTISPQTQVFCPRSRRRMRTRAGCGSAHASRATPQPCWMPMSLPITILHSSIVRVGTPKSTSRNARQAHSCINASLEIKVSTKALLQLANRCRQQHAASKPSTFLPEQGGSICNLKFPPRPTTGSLESATTIPLEQLWKRLPPTRQRELVAQLTRILAQRLTPPTAKEESDE